MRLNLFMFLLVARRQAPRRAVRALSTGPLKPGLLAHLVTPAACNYDLSQFDNAACSVAVAFQPKTRENVFRQKRESPSGEDNLFVAVDEHVALGVADGVGGWSEAGYDSLAISRELCSFMRQGFKKGTAPQDLLARAYAQVLALPHVEIGGTTACVGVLSRKQLRVANLGDSWCGVFRNHTLVHETRFQTHNFNTPFQLAKIPKAVLRQAELEGRRYIVDQPSLCDTYEWDVEPGDIVVFATDGVTDNVVPQDIELFLRDHADASLQDVATELVAQTVAVSKDQNFPSAFAQELSRLTGQRYLGGKEDDITVVMARVK